MDLIMSYDCFHDCFTKSSNHSGIMVPTRNVTMRNLAIKSRNWCIGSGTFGGIYDLLFEDSTIGDLETVSFVLFDYIRIPIFFR